MAVFLEHLPASLHVLLLSRSTPALLLARLRARGEIYEIQAAMRGITLVLGKIYYEQAALYRAEYIYRQVLALAREVGDGDDTSHALQSLAAVAYERNALTTAEQLAQEALLLAQVEHAQGQHEAALQRYASLFSIMPSVSPLNTPLHAQLKRRIQAEQARIHLVTGDHTAVQLWASGRDQRDEQISQFQREHEELIIVRLLIVQGKIGEVQDMLTRLLASAGEAGRMRSMLQIQLLRAMAYAASKRLQEARQHLLIVLTEARTEGFLRLFLDEGEAMSALLHTLIPHIHEKALSTYARSILLTFAERRETEASARLFPGQLIEPLSPQEVRVLRLLVVGRSNREIAAEQIVSINSILTQVQSIYRKLGVNNRVGACEMARQLHLF